MQVSFKTDKFNFLATLDKSDAAQELFSRLPLEATVKRWGDEIYCETGWEDFSSYPATSEVRVGGIAFWPEGKCLCVFFGPTPQSSDERPVPASPVIVVGKTILSPDELRSVSEGEKITIAAQADRSGDTRIMSQNEIDSLLKQMRG